MTPYRDCETGNACPQCLGENLAYEAYAFGAHRETGYADSGQRFYCRDCGTTGDADDTVAALAMLPQSTRQPTRTVAADVRTCGVSLETKYLHLRQPVPLGHRLDGWRVCWLGGWDKQRVFFVVMLVRVKPQ